MATLARLNIKLQAEEIDMTLLCKRSDVDSNFALILGYLDPALNNPPPVNSLGRKESLCISVRYIARHVDGRSFV